MSRQLPVVDQARLDANLRAINVELDAPQPAWSERALRRCGVPSRFTRLVAATPALRRAWYLALFAVVLLGLATADAAAPRQSLLVFLTLAPLVPVLGVAMAYGPASDPGYEKQLATPIRGIRLVAIRTFVVLLVSAVVVTALASLNDTARPFAIAWLLPALAVTGTSIFLMTLLTPRRASAIAAAAWFVVVLTSQVSSDPLVVFTVVGQVLAAIVAVATLVAVLIRRASFDHLAYTT